MVLLVAYIPKVRSQEWGIKTNILYDMTSTLNLGLEVGIGRQWSLDVPVNYNGWLSTDRHKFKHWMIQPELRYWLCRKYDGHFFGIHGHYAKFNVGGIQPISQLRNNRFQGRLYGGGISYGYQWILGVRWGLEATLGVGYVHFKYDHYRCWTCEERVGPYQKNYFGPTKAGISLIYLLK